MVSLLYPYDLGLDSKRPSPALGLVPLRHETAWLGRGYYRETGGARHDFAKKLDTLCRQVSGHDLETSHLAARLGQTVDEACREQIARCRDDNGDLFRRAQDGPGHLSVRHQNDVRSELDDRYGQPTSGFEAAMGIPPLNHNVPAF